MTHLDLLGNNLGSKVATLSMEARPLSASHVIRKVVVANIKGRLTTEHNFNSVLLHARWSLAVLR